jgi:hypothetical protein
LQSTADVFIKKLEERGRQIFVQKLKVEFASETDEQVMGCQKFAQSVIE